MRYASAADQNSRKSRCGFLKEKFKEIFFSNRVMPIWNNLSNHVVSADAVNCSGLTKRCCITTRHVSMAPETAVYYSSNFVILKFYHKVYFSDTEAWQGLHLFPLCDHCDVMWLVVCISVFLLFSFSVFTHF